MKFYIYFILRRGWFLVKSDFDLRSRNRTDTPGSTRLPNLSPLLNIPLRNETNDGLKSSL